MERTQTIILDALHQIGRPCRRSELAGVAEMTIKKMSRPLTILLERGEVVRADDGRYCLPLRTEHRKAS